MARLRYGKGSIYRLELCVKFGRFANVVAIFSPIDHDLFLDFSESELGIEEEFNGRGGLGFVAVQCRLHVGFFVRVLRRQGMPCSRGNCQRGRLGRPCGF